MLYMLTSFKCFDKFDCAGQHFLADKVGPEIRRLKMMLYAQVQFFLMSHSQFAFDVACVGHVVCADFF